MCGIAKNVYESVTRASRPRVARASCPRYCNDCFHTRSKILLICFAAAAVLGGCGAPTATLELITVARKGIADARVGQEGLHAELVRRLGAQSAALDSAFDADARLAEAGQIKDAQGRPVALSAEWVISARRGYAAARDLLAGQIRSAEKTHATRMDNLSAADEALELASQLILSQWAVREQIRRRLLAVRRSLIHDK